MSSPHDVTRQIGYVRQCLSQGDRNLGLLLGAGCPLAVRISNEGDEQPLIPDIGGLTKVVCEQILKEAACKGTLKIVLEHFKKDERPDPNIEDILTHIRSLRAVAGKDQVRSLHATQLEELDKEICERIVAVVDRPLPSPSPYHDLASWIGSTTRTVPVQLFTTNYDLLLEQALEERRVPYFDGFVGARRPFFDPTAMEENSLPARWARVWKLHGSINWSQDGHGVVCRIASRDAKQRRVIHPSHLKYEESRRMPYLAMIDRLRAFLRQPAAVLLICGYSFRDEHLNEALVQGLQGNPDAVAFGLLRGLLQERPKARDLALARSNLNLLGRDSAILGTREGRWGEREKTEFMVGQIGVEWTPKDPARPDEQQVLRFTLGDFQQLGRFLADLIGQRGTDGGGADAP